MLCYIISWKRSWQPIPVFLPGESHGQRSLVGYSPWGCKELDITERLTQNSNNILYLKHRCEDCIIGKGQSLQKNSCRKLDLHMQKNEDGSISYIQKIIENEMRKLNLNVTAKTIKLLRE